MTHCGITAMVWLIPVRSKRDLTEQGLDSLSLVRGLSELHHSSSARTGLKMSDQHRVTVTVNWLHERCMGKKSEQRSKQTSRWRIIFVSASSFSQSYSQFCLSARISSKNQQPMRQNSSPKFANKRTLLRPPCVSCCRLFPLSAARGEGAWIDHKWNSFAEY